MKISKMEPLEPANLIYVEKGYNPEINAFIQSNIKQIFALFSTDEIEFCYLPFLLQDKRYREIIAYNRPYIDSNINDLAVNIVYEKFLKHLKTKISGSGLLYIEYLSNGKFLHHYFKLEERLPLLEQFEKCAVEIGNFSDNYIIRKKSTIIQTRYPSIMEFLNEFELNDDQNADRRFEYEAFKLDYKMLEKILGLEETDLMHLIGDILEKILAKKPCLSSIIISDDYRIFLKDYGMKEVHMSPLSKALYILFLRHPKGIRFPNLPFYYEELLSIYKNITIHKNIGKEDIKCIRAITDPMMNSINEECSHIRVAFLEVIADELADNYYVTGKRREPKKIILDRSLVKFQ
jgi:hypothetical protein